MFRPLARLPTTLVFLAFAATAVAQPVRLFDPVTSVAPGGRYVPIPANALYSQDVLLDTRALDSSVVEAEVAPGDVLLLDRQDRVTRGTDESTWTGTATWADGSGVGGSAIVVVKGPEVTANIRIDGRLFQVRPTAPGIHRVTEIDMGSFDPCTTPDAPMPDVPNVPPRFLLLDDGSIIDVMIVYTQAAENSVADIDAEIQLVIDEVNQSYLNSDIAVRIRLVDARLINYTESNNSGTDLARLRDTSDGFMDEVHAWRDSCGADDVSLWVEDLASSCGRGYLMTNPGAAFERSAFNVCQLSCATGNLTYAHELGHNQGCAHDHANAGGAAYAYSYGYRVAGQFRTVMAYNCNPGCPRQPHFSNPDIDFMGQPTGIPDGMPDPADNARSIDETAFIFSNFRQSRNGCCDPDLFEVADACNDAVTINDGDTQTRNICEGTEDWLSFSACAGGNVTLEVTNQEPASQVLIEIVDPSDCTTVLASDDAGGTGVGSRIDWNVVTAGRYLVRVTNIGDAGADTGYDISMTGDTVPDLSGCCSVDAFPGDACPAAPLMTGGSSQVRNFCEDTEDWLSFVACLGDSYDIQVSGQEARSQVRLELMSDDCSSVLASDDAGGTGIGSRIQWTATASGDYRVRLTSLTGTGADTGFTVSLTGMTPPDTTSCCTADAFEGMDACPVAAAVQGGGSQDRNFCNDQADTLRIVTCAAETYVIEVTNQEARSQVRIEVWDDACGTQLASDDAGGTGRGPSLQWQAPQSGEYRVILTSLNGTGSDQGYRVSVSGNTPPDPSGCCMPDAYEPVDSCSQAGLLLGGGSQDRNFCQNGEDWLAFTACEGRDYRIEVTNQEAQGDVRLELFMPGCGAILASDDAAGSGRGSRIDWNASASGTYWVRAVSIAGSVGAATGYSVSITGDTTPCEPSSVGSPRPMRLERLLTGEIAVRVENVESETGYLMYDGLIGTWYGRPGQTCFSSWDDLPAITELLTTLGPGNRWLVMAATNDSGASSAGIDSLGSERRAAPGWPAPIRCP